MNTSMGERIRKLRRSLGLDRITLAKSMGVSDVTIGYWERDKHPPKGQNLLLLAKRLKTTSEYLASGQLIETEAAKAKSPHSIQIPILSLSTAKKWGADYPPSIADAIGWHPVALTLSNFSFAVIAKGDPMINSSSPPIMQGARIIIEPLMTPKDGDLVLIDFENSDHAILKQLVLDGPNHYLKSLNPEYKNIQLDERSRIIGVAKRIEYDV